jgi:hypothetical protein
LKSIYPNYAWKPWRFAGTQIPANYWMNVGHQREYWQWLATELNLNTQSDWYDLDFMKVKETGGFGILQYYDGSMARGRT